MNRLPFKVLVQDMYPNRSPQWNKYYWGVTIKMIADYTGYSSEEIHELLGFKFRMSYYFDFKSREMDYKYMSTTQDSDSEFALYIEQVRAWALEFLNLLIPDPNEVIVQDEVTLVTSK